MKKGTFRPCIDIHDGHVKQIVGGALTDSGSVDNFVSDKNAAYYANLYREKNLSGGHIILLNKIGTPEYEADKYEAFKALEAFPGGMSIGGGITLDNAGEFLESGASHVIVTSYVFTDGKIDYDKLVRMYEFKRVILDLSARRVGDDYYVATDRWQNISDVKLSDNLFYDISGSCSEFLIHAVDVEGKKSGIEKLLAEKLSYYSKLSDTPITYAGGVRDMDDARFLSEKGLHFTVGSALDIFGGNLSFDELAKNFGKTENE
ncbi:MAG: phosphoribosylformimino-5-aminoimidazole carboxamide ribotide isomerase [Ruminococcus sp.]|jgi:phosphoribosylformimino-5-aminoimidazole carboxamide ribotide isomerase|nr:phosphoribosylformimino-5-aminoimidazole carboxamide ribotide isomerase [Ruminococcus sp.]